MSDDIDADASATHQPTLPDLDLPEYMGRKPVGMRTSVNGAGNRITKHHGIGDRVILVLEAKVKKAGHEDTDDGLLYTEVLKVVDLFEVAGDPGKALISTMRSAYRTAKDEADGKTAIPTLGEAGYTDASGVVLTSREVAALRGDPVRAMVTDDLIPAVIVYDDDYRQLWPDDFVKDSPRPHIGQRIIEDDVIRTVAKLLDTATGETLAGIAWEVDDDAEDIIVDDDIPPFETPDDDVPAIDDIDDDEEPPTPEAAALEAELPTTDDFAFVDTGIPDLRDNLEDVVDAAQLRRLINAEKQGRGRGLKYRKGALDAIHARLETVENGVRLKVVK